MRILKTSPFLSEGQGRVSSMDDHCSAGIQPLTAEFEFEFESFCDVIGHGSVESMDGNR